MLQKPDALLLDAGNTLVFLDVTAIAAVCREEGVDVDERALGAAHARAHRTYERRLAEGGHHEDGWTLLMRSLLEGAGIAPQRAESLVGPIRRAHDQLNLWRRVGAGVPAALDRARAMGIRLGVVSNSEGHIEALLQHVGLGVHLELVVDSALEGVHKPDPEIFRRALTRLGVEPRQAIYVGDIPAVDVGGARAAGMEGVLIDAFGHHRDYADAPRVESVAELVGWWRE